MRNTMRNAAGVLAVLVGVSLAFPAFAGESTPTVFKVTSDEGEVWVSVELARHRLGEEYLPMVVMVRNSSGKIVNLNRASFELVGADGSVEYLPEVKQLRDAYKKVLFDRKTLQGFGLQIDGRLTQDRAVPVDFFPVVGVNGDVLIDKVGLPDLHWTADILYFGSPAGAAEGRQLTLKVKPEGWEEAVKVKFSV